MLYMVHARNGRLLKATCDHTKAIMIAQEYGATIRTIDLARL